MVDDYELETKDLLNGWIMDSLELATKAGLVDVKFQVSGVKTDCVTPIDSTFTREGSIYRGMAIINDKDLSKLKVTLSYKDPQNDY